LSEIHGFFAIMGGFAQYDDGEGPYIIDPDGLEDYLRKDDIMGEAIMDRSKGDALSKGIAILQTGWFILQCIARKIQGLAVTELEVVTLAFATPTLQFMCSGGTNLSMLGSLLLSAIVTS